jgi:hypothetical protein
MRFKCFHRDLTKTLFPSNKLYTPSRLLNSLENYDTIRATSNSLCLSNNKIL